MSDRTDAIRDFLAAAGWGEAAVAPLAGDASPRRYFRLTGGPGGAGAVLMDAPAERGEDVGPFLAMTDYLRSRGLSAPEILAEERAAGLLLLEDLGDDLFARVCARDPAAEPALYAAAVDLLAYLHVEPPPARIGDFAPPPYGMDFLLQEAGYALDWWVAAASGAPVSADLVAEYRAIFAGVLAGVATDRSALVLRDYHAENLLWLPGRASHARVGLLDYQGAMLGSPAYDLASLLEDARRDVAPELQAAMVDRYVAAAGVDREAFAAAFAALAAQRNLKIIGIFARLWLRDGKPGYLDLIPRVWGHVLADLAHPALAPLRAFVAAHVPAPDAAALRRVRGAR